MFSDVGMILGPVVAGFLADTASLPAAFGGGAIFFLLTSAYAFRMPGDRQCFPEPVRVEPPHT